MGITHSLQSQYSHWRPDQVELVDGRPVRFRDVCVHEFAVSDNDDPEIYAAEPLWQWQKSEAGQWIMANAAAQPYWINHIKHESMCYQFKVMARLSEQNETFWRLKWGGLNK